MRETPENKYRKIQTGGPTSALTCSWRRSSSDFVYLRDMENATSCENCDIH